MEEALQIKIWVITGCCLYIILMIIKTYEFIKEENKDGDCIYHYVMVLVAGLPTMMFLGVPVLILVIPMGIIIGIPYLLIKGIVLLTQIKKS